MRRMQPLLQEEVKERKRLRKKHLLNQSQNPRRLVNHQMCTVCWSDCFVTLINVSTSAYINCNLVL